MDTPDVYLQLKQYLSSLQVDDEQTAIFCSKFKVRRTKRNELLLQAGEVCPHIYFVNSGCLRVYMMDVEGRESTRFLIFENGFGTAFPSFTLQEPSLAYIQSIEPSEVLYLSLHDFRDLLDNFPGWERLYRIKLEMDYIASIKRIESLITMDAKQRYNLLMDTHPRVIQRLPSRIVADYLGISQETLSRLKSKK
jgi:CRP-like cAMP-binding protein